MIRTAMKRTFPSSFSSFVAAASIPPITTASSSITTVAAAARPQKTIPPAGRRRSPTMTSPTAIQTRGIHDLYTWGTSKNGIIPVPPAYDNSAKTTLDFPRRVDVEDVFGFAEDGNLLKTPRLENSSAVPARREDVFGFAEDGNLLKTPRLDKFICGPGASAAIFDDGRCYTWGANDYGQLGHDHKKPVLTPTPLPSSLAITSASLGLTSSAFVTTDKTLYTCGHNGSALQGGTGWLATGSNTPLATPTLVTSLVEDECLVAEAAMGECHLTVVTTEGEVLTAGAGSYGRLGNLESTDQLYLEPVEMLAGEVVVSVASGANFSLALTEEG
eukprot:CAMPEP_0172520526 /NCGR_PEP_ID=MMETSP1066-20121228/292060_1 /TAXON_ID=671091 /ORGANISM="Coscinodiscus wailesii, Strain CCMP2513" /LENGTH=329 /DNA_ID=CAMNT_0013303307 /DNA_START=245 /DNA_END=1232 /DNA_ORIENTATION=+